jgi:hypothetical protein
LFFVLRRASACVEISEIRCGLATLLEVLSADFQLTFSAFWIISSAMVFHSLHELHCPCHLTEKCGFCFGHNSSAKINIFTLQTFVK